MIALPAGGLPSWPALHFRPVTELAGQVNPVRRLNSLTGLRWWAALGVYVAHMRNFAPLPGTFDAFQFGNYGVMFFFILSGFVLTWSMKPGMTVRTFYVNRLARIWPATIVALVFAVPVFYSTHPNPEQTYVKPLNWAILALSPLFAQGWWREPVVMYSGNPVAWTLSLEFFFYAVHPLIYTVLRRLSSRTSLMFAGIIIGLALAYRTIAVLDPGFFMTSWPYPILRLDEFILGMCVAHAMRRGWRATTRTWMAVSGLVALVLADRFTRRDVLPVAMGHNFVAYENELLLIGFTALIAAAASREILGRRSFFDSRPLVTLGEWSFAFYLVHSTVMYSFITLFGAHRARWDNVMWYAPTFALALLAAAALHLWVEKPLERRIRAGWTARTTRQRSGTVDQALVAEAS